jgi:hypothetical protein
MTEVAIPVFALLKTAYRVCNGLVDYGSYSSSLHMGFSARISGLDAAGTPVCTTLQQLPPRSRQAVKVAVLNNRRLRALSATVVYWWTSPGADETDCSSEARPFETKKNSRETESLDENSRLVCNTDRG